MQGTINPLVAFLDGESTEIIVGADEYAPFDEVAKIYRVFCRQRNASQVRFNEDHYRDIFQQRSITVAKPKEAVTWRGREYDDITFVFGIGIRNNELM
jgi:hypothetical protein